MKHTDRPYVDATYTPGAIIASRPTPDPQKGKRDNTAIKMARSVVKQEASATALIRCGFHREVLHVAVLTMTVWIKNRPLPSRSKHNFLHCVRIQHDLIEAGTPSGLLDKNGLSPLTLGTDFGIKVGLLGDERESDQEMQDDRSRCESSPRVKALPGRQVR